MHHFHKPAHLIKHQLSKPINSHKNNEFNHLIHVSVDPLWAKSRRIPKI